MVSQGPLVTPLQRIHVGRHLGGPVHDVPTVVAVLRDLPTGGTGGQRGGELLHLDAAVVDVELPLHLVAAPFVEARHRVAVAGSPAVAGVQGTRRVGAHELDDDPRSGTGVEPTPAVGSGSHHVGQHLVQPGLGQAEVDEAGSGHLDADHVGRRYRRQALHEGGSELPWVPAGHLRRCHGHIGRPVAVLRIGRALQLDHVRQGVDAQVGQGGANRIDDGVAHVHGRIHRRGGKRPGPGHLSDATGAP